jgi:hypothetical protein
MRYYKGYIALSETCDVPVLQLVRNCRAICFDQLRDLLACEMLVALIPSLRWRVTRLEKFGLLSRLEGQKHFGRPIYGITRQGSNRSNLAATIWSLCRAIRSRFFTRRRSRMHSSWSISASRLRARVYCDPGRATLKSPPETWSLRTKRRKITTQWRRLRSTGRRERSGLSTREVPKLPLVTLPSAQLWTRIRALIWCCT